MKTRGADWVSFCPLKTLCLPQVPVEQQKDNYRNLLSQQHPLINKKEVHKTSAPAANKGFLRLAPAHYRHQGHLNCH